MKVRNYFSILLTLFIMFMFMSCDYKDGTQHPNSEPTIEITSWSGLSDANVETLEDDPYLFQQTLYWHAIDTDGIVEGYAFRILNSETLEPVQIPNYEYFQESENPDDNGWVYQNVGYSDDELSIWTTESHAVINFPANVVLDTMGVVEEVKFEAPFLFEVKCIDNRKAVCEVNAKKFYYSASFKPEINISSSQGSFDDVPTTGTGIKLIFFQVDKDLYVGEDAWYYYYRIDKVNEQTGEVIPEAAYPSNQDDFFSTLENPQEDRVWLRGLLADEEGSISPHLTPDVIDGNGEFLTKTRITAYSMDKASISSPAKEVFFHVSDKFFPKAYISNKRTTVLGANHFIPAIASGAVPNETSAQGEVKFATPFYDSKDNINTAIWSSDVRIYLNWGYFGDEESVPVQKEYPVLDYEEEDNYFTELLYYDVRYDNEPLYHLMNNGNSGSVFVHTDPDGSQWLRVSKNNSLAKEIVLFNQTSGEHLFEVRVVDLQLKTDQVPASIAFTLVEPIFDEKDGILVIDAEADNGLTAPDLIIDNLYEQILEFYTGRIDYIDLDELAVQNEDENTGVITPSDIMSYKTIIYHNDNVDGSTNMDVNWQELNAYLRTGGNLIISSTGTIVNAQSGTTSIKAALLLSKYFGLNDSGSIKRTSVRYNNTPIFWGATSENYGNVDLELINSPFILVNTMFKGLGNMAFFDTNASNFLATPIFSMVCKPVDYETPSPNPNHSTSQEDFDFFTGKPVAVKYQAQFQIQGNMDISTNCYLFGFPFSMMEVEGMRNTLQKVIEEIENQ